MKKSFRTLVALLTLLILTVSLIGCGSAANNATESQGAQTTAGNAETTAAQKPREEVTLSAFIMQSVSSKFGLAEDWIAEIMKKDLGIKVEFLPTGDQVEQKFQALLAGGELPDIIGFKETKHGKAAMEAGMLLCLDDYQDKLPNIFNNDITKHAVNYYRNEVSKDGKLYIMPSAIGPLGATKDTNWKPQLLWDVYEDIGRPEINTLEDYLPVIKKMQEAYPKNEAGERVYGFELFSDWDNLSALQVGTLSFMYGIDTEYVSQLMEAHVTKHTINSLLDENSFYKRALKFYYNANQMGLLDPDSLTQKFDTVQEKYTAGRVLFTHFSWMTGKYNDRASGHVDADDPNGYEMVAAKDMKIYDAPNQTIGRAWSFGITKSTKYADRALELFNWLYSVETQELYGNGPEGVLWKKNDKGEPYITDEGWAIIDKKGETQMPLPGGGLLEDPGKSWNTLGYSGSLVNPKTGFTITYRYWPASLSRNPTKLQQEWRDLTGCTTMIEYLNKNNMVSPATQAINMIPTAPDDLQMKMSQIGDVVKTNSWKMVFAKNQADFDTFWSDMVKKADGLGMKEVVDYYTNAWKAALEKVSKYED